MIGDSWQLRKHSLLGHWPVHSVEPPGPWRTCENGKRGGGKRGGGRWGWANKSRNRKDGELAKNQQGKKCCTCWQMEAERHIQTDEWRGGRRYEECKNKRSVIADERVDWQCRNKDVGEMKAERCGEEKLPSLCCTAVLGRVNCMENEEQQVQNQGIQDSKAGQGRKASACKPRTLIGLVRPRVGSADDTKQLQAVTERWGWWGDDEEKSKAMKHLQ